MNPPKQGNPLAWGLITSIAVAGLMAIAHFFPEGKNPFKDPSAAMAGAFAWGFVICLIKDNLAYWLWRRANSRRH